MGLKIGSKISAIYSRGTLSNWGLNKEGVEKMCVFQRKTGHIWETVRDTA